MANPNCHRKAGLLMALFCVVLTFESCGGIHMVEKTKCRPIYYDVSSEDADCYQLQTDLVHKAVSGDLDGVRAAIENGANVNGGADDYLRPLTIAAEEGHEAIVGLLLQHGANIDATSSGIGATPLTAAISGQHYSIVKLLLSHGANVCQVIEGTTPLQTAEQLKSVKIINLLIEAGAENCSS